MGFESDNAIPRDAIVIYLRYGFAAIDQVVEVGDTFSSRQAELTVIIQSDLPGK